MSLSLTPAVSLDALNSSVFFFYNAGRRFFLFIGLGESSPAVDRSATNTKPPVGQDELLFCMFQSNPATGVCAPVHAERSNNVLC